MISLRRLPQHRLGRLFWVLPYCYSSSWSGLFHRLPQGSFTTAFVLPSSPSPQKMQRSFVTMAPSDNEEPPVEPPKKRRGRPRKVKVEDSPVPSGEKENGDNTSSSTPSPQKKPKVTPKAKRATAKKEDSGDEGASAKKKLKKAPAHQQITTRSEIPKLWDSEKAVANGSSTFKIASWNVAGIRSMLKKTPTVFREFVDRHDLDMLCLQETRLQEMHLEDPKLKIRETMQLQDYDDYWSCSTSKKGYSGTAVFVRKGAAAARKKSAGPKQSTLSFAKTKSGKAEDSTVKTDVRPDRVANALLVPELVSFALGKDAHDTEGRIVTVDLPLCTICNVYVPNAGQKLDRLSYRTTEWDTDLLAFMENKQKERNVPVMWLGDLNVAHTKLEVWNDGAKHLPKQPGVTAEERASFTAQLEAGYVDSFRRLHPEAEGHYSFWSTRVGNRPVNKGLRLDYFVAHESFFSEDSKAIVRDSYVDHEQLGSDHCPVLLEVEFKL